MRYPHYEGVGERIRARLVALGFKLPDGKADSGRFVREKKWDGRYFYNYLKGVTPTGERLDRLVDDLQTSRSWLLTGEGSPSKKFAKRVLTCLLAFLGLTAAGMVLGQGDALAAGVNLAGMWLIGTAILCVLLATWCEVVSYYHVIGNAQCSPRLRVLPDLRMTPSHLKVICDHL